MPAPNLFIVYVTDVAASSVFYSELFEMSPSFVSPQFVEFEVAPSVGFALWPGRSESIVSGAHSRGNEVWLNLPGGPEVIEQQYRRWCELGVTIVQEPHDDVFGHTLIAQDPDGNLLRVAPIDAD